MCVIACVIVCVIVCVLADLIAQPLVRASIETTPTTQRFALGRVHRLGNVHLCEQPLELLSSLRITRFAHQNGGTLDGVCVDHACGVKPRRRDGQKLQRCGCQCCDTIGFSGRACKARFTGTNRCKSPCRKKRLWFRKGSIELRGGAIKRACIDRRGDGLKRLKYTRSL